MKVKLSTEESWEASEHQPITDPYVTVIDDERGYGYSVDLNKLAEDKGMTFEELASNIKSMKVVGIGAGTNG